MNKAEILQLLQSNPSDLQLQEIAANSDFSSELYDDLEIHCKIFGPSHRKLTYNHDTGDYEPKIKLETSILQKILDHYKHLNLDQFNDPISLFNIVILSRFLNEDTNILDNDLKIAADQDHLLAQYEYAKSQEYPECFEYLEKSSNQGCLRSTEALGYIHTYGNGCPYELSMKYYKMNADNGNYEFQNRLAKIYESKHNLEDAFYYYSLCSKSGTGKYPFCLNNFIKKHSIELITILMQRHISS